MLTESVIYFGAYEGLRQYFTVNDNISAFGQIMSGGLAGALAWAYVRALFFHNLFFTSI